MTLCRWLMVVALVVSGCSATAAEESGDPADTSTLVVEQDDPAPATKPAGQPGPAATGPPPIEVVTMPDLEFAPDLRLTAYAPAELGPWPVVVVLPGGGWRSADPESTAPFAEYLAGRGAVVFNATYRLSVPQAFTDVVCAVRFAIERAQEYGGDAARLVLTGHSAGAATTSVVALGGESFTAGDCAATAPFAAPGAWVGLSGPYEIRALGVVPDLVRFVGGTAADVPEAWRAADPYEYVDRVTPVDITLVHGLSDIAVLPVFSQRFADALRAAGREVVTVYVEGAGHRSMIDPDRAGVQAADAILDAASRLG